MPGTPVQIYRIDGKKRSLDLKTISSIFRGVQDKPIALVSINGIKRSGKSFFLNFLLHFLQSNGHTDPDWMRRQFGGSKVKSNGFEWVGGAERKTIGIWLWSEPIIVRTDAGDEVAVVLMDTQGSFDGKTSFDDNALIFATSVWLSSLFIYNLKDDLSEDKLQFLEFFADFSNGIQGIDGAANGPLFQHLLLLIRDWAWPQDYEHGWHVAGEVQAEGRNYTDDFLHGQPNQSEEGLTARRDIAAKFLTTSSFLLPHPGLPVAQNATSNLTALDKVEPSFLQHFQDLLSLVRQEILKPKVLYGQAQTGRSMVAIMRKWAQLLDSREIPQAKSLTQATAQANLEVLLHRTEKQLHKKLLEITARGISDTDFERERNSICDQTLDNFIELSSGFPKYQMEFVGRLEETIKNSFTSYAQFNSSKRAEMEKDVEIREMKRRTEGLSGTIDSQNARIEDLQRDLVTQNNLSHQEQEKLMLRLEQVKEETAAMVLEKENALQEQQRHALELEQQMLASERREFELARQVTRPRQLRESDSDIGDTVKDLVKALAPLAVELFKLMAATSGATNADSSSEDSD